MGTEIDPRFRLSLGFTSFETKIRRTASGKWEEGSYASKAAASGLHSQAGPSGEPASLSGGVVVEQAFHTYSLGPRLDFLPLGSGARTSVSRRPSASRRRRDAGRRGCRGACRRRMAAVPIAQSRRRSGRPRAARERRSGGDPLRYRAHQSLARPGPAEQLREGERRQAACFHRARFRRLGRNEARDARFRNLSRAHMRGDYSLVAAPLKASLGSAKSTLKVVSVP